MRKRGGKKSRNAGRAGGERAFYNSVALIAASETVQKKGWGQAKYMAFSNNNKSYAIYRPKNERGSVFRCKLLARPGLLSGSQTQNRHSVHLA